MTGREGKKEVTTVNEREEGRRDKRRETDSEFQDIHKTGG